MLGVTAIISRRSLQRLRLRAFPACYISRSLSLCGWRSFIPLSLCTAREFLSHVGCAGGRAGMCWRWGCPGFSWEKGLDLLGEGDRRKG